MSITVGQKAYITDTAWERACEEREWGDKPNPSPREVVEITPQGRIVLDFPLYYWLPGDLEPVELIDLADVRAREEREFQDEQVAYLEALWGKSTFAFDLAVRDLEAMRRDTEDPRMPLRPPETYYETEHMIKHVRALANDIARFYGMPELVRDEDDIGGRS